jgi:hypothetical protein
MCVIPIGGSLQLQEFYFQYKLRIIVITIHHSKHRSRHNQNRNRMGDENDDLKQFIKAEFEEANAKSDERFRVMSSQSIVDLREINESLISMNDGVKKIADRWISTAAILSEITDTLHNFAEKLDRMNEMKRRRE